MNHTAWTEQLCALFPGWSLDKIANIVAGLSTTALDDDADINTTRTNQVQPPQTLSSTLKTDGQFAQKFCATSSDPLTDSYSHLFATLQFVYNKMAAQKYIKDCLDARLDKRPCFITLTIVKNKPCIIGFWSLAKHRDPITMHTDKHGEIYNFIFNT
eukprot:8987712-Ditylum_brightwellii.AAC.1